MVQTNFYRISFSVLIALALLSVQSKAQDDVNSYKVGERVEYKDRSYPEVWKEGTVVRVYPEYKQVLVHWDPRPDYPQYTHDGVSSYEQAYNINDVRHIKARANEQPARENRGASNTAPNEAANGRKEKGDAPKATNNGGGLMTKEEILGYIRTNGYANGQPKHDPQVCKDIIEQIKQRGVKEPLAPGKDDLSPIAENGCFGAQNTDVVAASRSNIGTPTTLDWLSGTWLMYVIGGTVDTAPGDGYIYRKNESIGKLGFLTINSNGTYIWKVEPVDPPAKYLKGTWRKATKEEMNLQGGAGIVLQKAAEGSDWLVFKYMDPFNKAERIDVRQMHSTGGYRRIGWRR